MKLHPSPITSMVLPTEQLRSRGAPFAVTVRAGGEECFGAALEWAICAVGMAMDRVEEEVGGCRHAAAALFAV